MSAFAGDGASKAAMIASVSSRWKAGRLIPASILKWEVDSNIHSLFGALAETQDRTVFEDRTGIPLECAMLCEALMTPAVDVVADTDSEAGFIVTGPGLILSFGLEWLDAVRPGADLSDVVPRFAASFLTTVAAVDFAMAKHVEAPVRTSAERILALWTRELAGDWAKASEWSAVRRDAMLAAERSEDPWGHTVATFVESIAWPVRGLAPEFVSLFQSVLATWMNYVQRPFFSEADQRDQDLALMGWKRLAEVSREGGGEGEAEAALDAMPDTKRVMESAFDTDVKARRAQAHENARVATDPLLRGQMSVLLNLIAEA